MLFLAKDNCNNTWTSKTVAISYESKSLTAKKSVILIGCLTKRCAALTAFKLTPFSWKGYIHLHIWKPEDGRRALPCSPTCTDIIKPMFLLNCLRVWEFVFHFDEHLLPRNCCNAWGLTIPTGMAPGTPNSTLKKSSGISSPCCYRHTLRCHLQMTPALPRAIAPPLFPMTSITPPFFLKC